MGTMAASNICSKMAALMALLLVVLFLFTPIAPYKKQALQAVAGNETSLSWSYNQHVTLDELMTGLNWMPETASGLMLGSSLNFALEEKTNCIIAFVLFFVGAVFATIYWILVLVRHGMPTTDGTIGTIMMWWIIMIFVGLIFGVGAI